MCYSVVVFSCIFFFFKQKTAYEMRISDWSSDVCSSDLFSAVWGVLPHLLLDILEDLVWENKGLRDLYTKSKALYLEDELERIVRAGFPNGQVFTGSTWQTSDGVTYENDLTMVIRSEEHTSELQSLMRISYAVFCLKKKKNTKQKT